MLDIENNEFCKNCKYIRKLKHNFKVGEGFEESHVCVVWEYVHENYDDMVDCESFCLEVAETSMCEMFSPKDGTDSKE